MPSVAAITDAVGRHSGFPASRVRTVSRRLQDAGVLPRSIGGRVPPVAGVEGVVALVVGMLTDAPLHSVADATRGFLAFRETDDDRRLTASGLIAEMLTGLANLDPTADVTRFAMRSSVSVVSGDRPAVVIRTGTAEADPVEWAFTETGGPWKPESAPHFSKALTLSGFALFKIVSELGLGIERRTYPAGAA